ncbi:MAG: hypothetical protein Q4G67_04010, partial [Actinomycetia bacterium]|nr:hypothetical protein [Actinomycetes bacterium]
GASAVGLTGGVFVNRVLLAATVRALGERGIRTLTHDNVPANDGGLSLGQAAVGSQLLTSSRKSESRKFKEQKEIRSCV